MSSRVIFFLLPCLVKVKADFVIVTADALIQSTNSLTASRATITAPLCFINLRIGLQLIYFPYVLLF